MTNGDLDFARIFESATPRTWGEQFTTQPSTCNPLSVEIYPQNGFWHLKKALGANSPFIPPLLQSKYL